MRNVVWPPPEPANQKVRRFRSGYWLLNSTATPSGGTLILKERVRFTVRNKFTEVKEKRSLISYSTESDNNIIYSVNAYSFINKSWAISDTNVNEEG